MWSIEPTKKTKVRSAKLRRCRSVFCVIFFVPCVCPKKSTNPTNRKNLLICFEIKGSLLQQSFLHFPWEMPGSGRLKPGLAGHLVQRRQFCYICGLSSTVNLSIGDNLSLTLKSVCRPIKFIIYICMREFLKSFSSMMLFLVLYTGQPTEPASRCFGAQVCCWWRKIRLGGTWTSGWYVKFLICKKLTKCIKKAMGCKNWLLID